MKKPEILDTRIICESTNPLFPYFAWPSVARLSESTLGMAASGFRVKHVCPFGKGVLCYSHDEGATWSAPGVIIDTPLDDRDCGIVPFGNHQVIFTSFNNGLAFQREVNGMDRAQPCAAARERADFIQAYLRYARALQVEDEYIGSTYRISYDDGATFGALRRAPVSAPHGPCRLNDGTLLFIGTRFNGDPNRPLEKGEAGDIQCWRMDAAGAFIHVSSIENASDEDGSMESCEPHAIQLPNGKIIVHIRMQREGEHKVFTLYQSESFDNGLSFTRPHAVMHALGGAPAHLLAHSGGVLVSAYGHRESPYGIRAMLSKDEGETWDVDWILADQGMSSDLGYPATVERKDGSLLSVYYQNLGGKSVITQCIWRLPTF